MEKEIIKEFRYYNNFLSNFSRDPVLYRDILFTTSEHAYQWDNVKVSVMEEILRCKFSDEYLEKKLLATGDAKLIEGNYWHDNFWGVCMCPKCKNKEGLNHLGKLLMKIRN